MIPHSSAAFYLNHANCKETKELRLSSPLPEPRTLVEKISCYYFLNGISTQYFTKMLGIDPSEISRMKSGKRKPGKKTIA